MSRLAGTLSVDLVGEREAEVLAGLMRRCLPPSQRWKAADIRHGLAARHLVPMIASLAERPVGFCLAGTSGEEAEILSLAVLPDYRCKGLGSSLMRSQLEYLSVCGMRRFVLEVSAGNAAAQSLYLKCGFKKVGVRKGYYSHLQGLDRDAVVMLLGA